LEERIANRIRGLRVPSHIAPIPFEVWPDYGEEAALGRDIDGRRAKAARQEVVYPLFGRPHSVSYDRDPASDSITNEPKLRLELCRTGA
jgi:hypothetical protein